VGVAGIGDAGRELRHMPVAGSVPGPDRSGTGELMAENIQEIPPPEPPPKPPEVPKPTGQSNGSQIHRQPTESQQSAHEEMRNAARSEYAQATSAEDGEGLPPTRGSPTPPEQRNDQRRTSDEQDSPAEHNDAKVAPDIADEIASSPVDVRTKPHLNSAGETVDRYIIADVDDLLPLAENLGLGELSHDKDDYYSGQLPDGRYRKIEWNLQGHPETNEGPHVKVMETVDPWSSPSKGGNRWKTRAMIFVDGHEQFKKQWH
jgi:hypothetical protein